MAVQDVMPNWIITILFAGFCVSCSESAAVFLSRVDDGIRAQVSDILFERQGVDLAGFLAWLAFNVVLPCLSLLFAIAFLIAYAYDGGWMRVASLLLITTAAYALYSFAAVVLRTDAPPAQIVGTGAAVLALVLMLALAFQVTWFGLRSGSPA